MKMQNFKSLLLFSKYEAEYIHRLLFSIDSKKNKDIDKQ
jgi:hypothetical protein